MVFVCNNPQTLYMCVFRLCGSYTDMNAGSPSEAFKDFCGGVFMNYELRNEHDNDHDKELWGTLTRATACQAMIGCGTFSADVRPQAQIKVSFFMPSCKMTFQYNSNLLILIFVGFF